VSPLGNYLPDYVDPPGGERGDFTYVDLGTESVYSRLIQVEVYYEGARMFFAHATGDTFRDVTIEGSIEDARGVVSRFSEVVLVEDTRPYSLVVAYKFDRLQRFLDAPPPIGPGYCPDGGVQRYAQLVQAAKDYHDEGLYEEAILALERLNLTVRNLAGWCTPDTSPNNLAGAILAQSKTLMFSLGHLVGEDFATDDPLERLSLVTEGLADGRSVIHLTGPVGERAAARVYSASGRLVTTLFDGRLSSGNERLVWNGTDGDGQRVASGVYFVRLEADGGVRSSKVILIR